MAKKYIGLDKHVMDCSQAELINIFGDADHIKKSRKLAYVMRSIIFNERDFLKVDYERTLRYFWYATVKPTLEKLGLLRKAYPTEKVMTKRTRLLSDTFSEMVEDGELCCGDIMVVDTSRLREKPYIRHATADIDTYGFQVGVAPFPNIILAVEKDALYPVVANVARLFGCSCISGKGLNAFSAMEDLLRKIDTDQNIYFLTFTDYDPTGYYISDTFANQAAKLKHHLKIKGKIYSQRLGLTPDLLTPAEVEANKYTPEPGGADGITKLQKWFDETGGINGEPKGLELDSLPPFRITQVFANTLRDYIEDQTPYKAFVKEAYIKMRVLEGMRDKIEQIVTDIAGRESDNIQQYGFDIFDLAEQGETSIPIQDLCSANRDQAIKEQSMQYFK